MKKEVEGPSIPVVRESGERGMIKVVVVYRHDASLEGSMAAIDRTIRTLDGQPVTQSADLSHFIVEATGERLTPDFD